MPRIPTTPENLARINKFFDSVLQAVVNLAERWLDEHEYEDIADYGRAIQKLMPEGFRLTRMHKRPFGFDFTIGTEAIYKMSVSSSRAGWKRVS